MPRWCCRKSPRSPNASPTMSAPGAFAASRHNAVAPGDSLSKPALAAVNPRSEWVRLSNQSNRLTEEAPLAEAGRSDPDRSEEHTSELQSRLHLVSRLLLDKKKLSAPPSPLFPTPHLQGRRSPPAHRP